MTDNDRFAYCKLGCPWVREGRLTDGRKAHTIEICGALWNQAGKDESCAIQNCAFLHWAKALKGEELPTLPPRKSDSAAILARLDVLERTVYELSELVETL